MSVLPERAAERFGLNEVTNTYRATLQPFGQVPAYEEDGLRLFESGSIVHHIALKSEALMPRDPKEQAKVTQWMFAALSSVENADHMASFDESAGPNRP